MDIKYIGHSSFEIKGKNGTVITDPYDAKSTGLKFPALTANIVTISHHHSDHDVVSQISGDPIVFDIPGEYESGGIRVTGYPSFHDEEKGAKRGLNTLFKIEIDDLSILHCGDLGHVLEEEMVEEIDLVDILLVPVGGTYTIGPEEAAKVVSKIEPAIVIPMHYGNTGLNQATFGALVPVSQFLHARGVSESIEPVKKLSLKKVDLTDTETKIIVMES